MTSKGWNNPCVKSGTYDPLSRWKLRNLSPLHLFQTVHVHLTSLEPILLIIKWRVLWLCQVFMCER